MAPRGDTPMRWVGIDEAGYGPNLGPLVMTAVVAEGPSDRPPDLWADLASTVVRAGGDPDLVWVDDSKRIFRGGLGLDRLEAASLALLAATGRDVPSSLAGLLEALEAGTLNSVELVPHWLAGSDPTLPKPETQGMLDKALRLSPFDGAPWRMVSVRSVVAGPSVFNALLERVGSKAQVHFASFARLMHALWDEASDGVVTHVRADKHGARNFYLEQLYGAFPDTWIDRGPEGPELSRYTIRLGRRRIELCLCPRADAEDGLVALASMVSKLVRERWMEVFNAYWTACVPGLRPSAGYPRDAVRFREAIESESKVRGLDPSLWWRVK